MLTERLELRTLAESDRARFVELLMDPAFMVFSNGTHTLESAGDYFDHLLALNAELAFAKQPIVVRGSGDIVGYAGVDWFELRGTARARVRVPVGARGPRSRLRDRGERGAARNS